MAIGYLPRCGCGGRPAIFVASAGSYVECQRCRRRTKQWRRQAETVKEWREMNRNGSKEEGCDRA